MKINKAYILAVFILGLFLVGTTQSGLSTVIDQERLAEQPMETTVSFDPFLNNWIYRKQITIDHTQVVGDCNNFPVLIHIIDADLQLHAQSDGDDIIFMDGPLTATQLSHEIEMYESSNGELLVWVNIPSLSTVEDTVFYMYYGNVDSVNQEAPLQTWDQFYTGVWHLTNFSDSTSYGNHGTNEGSISTSGKIGDARVFDGEDNYILVDNNESLNFHTSNKFTISFWMKRARSNIYESIISKGTSAYTAGYVVQVLGDNSMYFGIYDGSQENQIFSNQKIVDMNWHYITTVWDGSTMSIYIDGSLDTSQYIGAKTIADDSKPLEFGHHYGYLWGQNAFGGSIDDVQIAKTNRDNAWISTAFNNQNAPSSFILLGDEEPIPFSKSIMFGKIANLDTGLNYIRCNAVKLRCLRFSPFSFTTYISNEELLISNDYLGVVTETRVVAFCEIYP